MNLQESIRRILREENKKSGLLRVIEEDGLFQVMQDTGLSMEQIILKYDNLPREVFERYIKDYIKYDGYLHPNGFYKLGYEVEISRNKYVDTFYLYGDSVTVEIKELDLGMMDFVSGGIEYLENLTDEEIFNIVDDITSWYSQNNL
jgi:hypothetical protein